MKLAEIDKNVLSSKPICKSTYSIESAAGGISDPNNIIIPLNKTAIWILQQLNGKSTVQDILDAAIKEYPDVNEEVLTRDVIDFVYNLYQWGYIQNVNLPKPSGYYAPAISIIDITSHAEGKSGCGRCKESHV